MANTIKILKNLADKLSPVLLLLVIAWLCWGIARTFWLFLSPIQAPNLPEVPRLVNTDMQKNNPNVFTIFAVPTPIEKAVTPVLTNANIDLKGVMVAVPEKNSSALISINGQMKNYRVGELLDATGYTLSIVDWNSITVIDSNNAVIDIKLNEPFELNQAYQANKSASNKKPVRNTPSRKPTTSPIQQSKKGLEGPPKNMAATALDNAAEQLEQDAAGYLSTVGVLATGDGYEVTDAMSAELRSRVGLKSGDKVISVNGQDVGSVPSSDAKLLRDIKQSKKAEIKVQRGEQVITIRQSF